MSKIRIAIAFSAALALGGLMFGASASAAPLVDRGVVAAVDLAAPKTEAIRMVCRHGECTWAPGRRGYRDGYLRRPTWGGRGYPSRRYNGYDRPRPRGYDRQVPYGYLDRYYYR